MFYVRIMSTGGYVVNFRLIHMDSNYWYTKISSQTIHVNGLKIWQVYWEVKCSKTLLEYLRRWIIGSVSWSNLSTSEEVFSSRQHCEAIVYLVMCEPCVGESFIALHENRNDYNRHACDGSLSRWRAGVIAAHLPCKLSRHEGNVSFCHLGLSPSIASAHTDHCSEDLIEPLTHGRC